MACQSQVVSLPFQSPSRDCGLRPDASLGIKKIPATPCLLLQLQTHLASYCITFRASGRPLSSCCIQTGAPSLSKLILPASRSAVTTTVLSTNAKTPSLRTWHQQQQCKLVTNNVSEVTFKLHVQLPRLATNHVTISSVSGCSHFPTYYNQIQAASFNNFFDMGLSVGRCRKLGP